MARMSDVFSSSDPLTASRGKCLAALLFVLTNKGENQMKSTKDEALNRERKMKAIPVMNIRMMTDDEWNRLAYKNWLERKAVAV